MFSLGERSPGRNGDFARGLRGVHIKGLLPAIGDRWFLSTVSVDRPRAVFEQSRYNEALSLVQTIDEVPAPADSEWQIKRRRIRARLLAREGNSRRPTASPARVPLLPRGPTWSGSTPIL
jgi:hypothetical protein